jgi:outer membrane protein, heavy metal efflux system
MKALSSILLITIFSSVSMVAVAQSSIETVLQSVRQNNKTILAQRDYEAARKIESKTGINPDNPFVEYDRLPGRPDGAGVQQEFSITQQLDFPTAYGHKRKVARQVTSQSETNTRIVRQGILADAKKVCIQIIYHNKRRIELTKRAERAQRLVDDISEKLKLSAATALDLNKARLQKLDAENHLRLNGSLLRQQLQKLTELNGGNQVQLPDTVYPELPELASLPILDSLIEAADPGLLSLKQQIEIDQAQLALSRALTLPKFQVGYHYQSILGQRYQGFHFGLSVPLWQQANTVKLAQANQLFNTSRLAAERSEHYSSIVQLYEQYQVQKQGLDQYRVSLTGLGTLQLLDTALKLSQITAIEYVLETTYLYAATDTLGELERDLHLTAVDLYKYQLN